MTDAQQTQNSAYVISPVVVPEHSSVTLERRKNSFIVRNGFIYEYFSISLDKETLKDRFIRIDKSPPVVADGIVYVNGKFIEVRSRDVLRRIIHASREYQVTAADTIGTNGTTTTGASSVGASAESNHQGISATDEAKEWEDARLAFKEQVGTLQYLSDQEEVGFVSFAPQSIPTNEVDAT